MQKANWPGCQCICRSEIQRLHTQPAGSGSAIRGLHVCLCCPHV